jgi:hypothetical protein
MVSRSPESKLGQGFPGDVGRREVSQTLGKRFGDRTREDQVDRAVKRFLSKSWNAREPATTTLDAALGTDSSPWKRNA